MSNWKCPFCGHNENWFDRTIYTFKRNGVMCEEGPFIRCMKCGRAESDKIIPKEKH